MGFDLKTFFEELEFMLRNTSIKEVEEFIRQEKEYAKQCNQL